LGAAPSSPETSDGGVSAADRDWVADAVRLIEADFNRSADTHLIRVDLARLSAAGVDLYLKDESTHPSGSLKHRLARSLFLYGLCNEITDAELAHADAYEVAAYVRVRAPLASGLEAWVYVDARGESPDRARTLCADWVRSGSSRRR
jgi:hypothetical protein